MKSFVWIVLIVWSVGGCVPANLMTNWFTDPEYFWIITDGDQQYLEYYFSVMPGPWKIRGLPHPKEEYNVYP
jgi:hypothetical protein